MDSTYQKINTHKNIWRLIESRQESPYINMASDEALMDFFSEGKIPPTLRFYGWHPDSFSFGLFQDVASLIDIRKCLASKVPFVRRMTGGGIVYHGSDISYSLVCHRSDLDISGGINDSYKSISMFLINAFRDLGMKAEYALKAPVRGLSEGGFCCQEREIYDIMVNGKKIGGHAQRRRRDVIFQHGFIPLNDNFKHGFIYRLKNQSEIDKGFTSLGDVLKRAVDYIEIKELLKKSFTNTFKIDFEKLFFTEEEKKRIDELVELKYAKSEWNIERLDYARSRRAPSSHHRSTGSQACMAK